MKSQMDFWSIRNYLESSKELLSSIVTLTFFLGHNATSVEVDAGSMIKVVVGGGGGTIVERARLMWPKCMASK